MDASEWNKGLKIAHFTALQEELGREGRGRCQTFDLCFDPAAGLWQVPSETQSSLFFLPIQHPLGKLLLPLSPSGVVLGTQSSARLEMGFVTWRERSVLFIEVNGIQGETTEEQLEFLGETRASGQIEMWKYHFPEEG